MPVADFRSIFVIWRSGVTILAEIGGSENWRYHFWVLEAKSMEKKVGENDGTT